MQEIRDVIEARFAEHQELERKRAIIAWYLPWLASKVTESIGAVWKHQATVNFDPDPVKTKPTSSIEERYAKAAFCVGHRCRVIGAFDKMGFRIVLGTSFKDTWQATAISRTQVQEVYDLLPEITLKLSETVETLMERIEESLISTSR